MWTTLSRKSGKRNYTGSFEEKKDVQFWIEKSVRNLCFVCHHFRVNFINV